MPPNQGADVTGEPGDPSDAPALDAPHRAPLEHPFLRRLLRRHRPLGVPLSCAPVAEGLLNHGYRLTTSTGRFFLKHHLDGDPAAIARQHRVANRLSAYGVPVAPPVPDETGETVTVVDGHCYAVHRWVEGRHRSGDELSHAESSHLGALLALVHTGLAEIMPDEEMTPLGVGRDGNLPARPTLLPGPRPADAAAADSRRAAVRPGGGRGPRGSPDARDARNPSDTDADPARTFALIEELLAHIRRNRRRAAFDELAEHRLTERRTLLATHLHDRPATARDTGGWVHGDFHPLNLMYRGTEPVAIVDWDRLGVQPRAEEAVRAAAIFFIRPSGTLDLAKIRRYARAYRRTAKATPREMASAVHRVWWERLNDFWMLRWHYQLGDRRADPQFPAAAALAVWWTREFEAVRDAFSN